ncbi:MAG: hypothetical protein Q9217_001071 [Psora testacea]
MVAFDQQCNTPAMTSRTRPQRSEHDQQESSRLLHSFLICHTDQKRLLHTNPSTARPRSSPNFLQRLPLLILRMILRFLLVSPAPLALDQPHSRPSGSPLNVNSPRIQSSVLKLCRQIYHVAIPVLYCENTFTTSTPSTSKNLNRMLAALPGANRQLIRSVKLEINWDLELWAHLPLVAKSLRELRLLQRLDISIMGGDGTDVRHIDAGKKMTRKPAEREGRVAQVMLDTEKKVLKDLVENLLSLKVFRLEGFEDANFAKQLQYSVCLKNT